MMKLNRKNVTVSLALVSIVVIAAILVASTFNSEEQAVDIGKDASEVSLVTVSEVDMVDESFLTAGDVGDIQITNEVFSPVHLIIVPTEIDDTEAQSQTTVKWTNVSDSRCDLVLTGDDGEQIVKNDISAGSDFEFNVAANSDIGEFFFECTNDDRKGGYIWTVE